MEEKEKNKIFEEYWMMWMNEEHSERWYEVLDIINENKLGWQCEMYGYKMLRGEA